MNSKSLFVVATLFCFSLFFQTCKVDDPVVDVPGSAYPDQVGRIMLTRCAISGCHNTQSKGACAGLDLSSWNTMFQGSNNGNAVTIPYAHDFSTLFLFSNSYSDLGLSDPPRMPLTGNGLSHDEETTLRSWIDAGAPDRNGYVKFSDNPNRKKFYVVNQGCDVVTVFDEQTLLPMRYIHIGNAGGDSPHMVRVSPDGNYWYVSFLYYPYLQRYTTSDDQFAGQVYVGSDSYNTFIISNDSRYAYCAGYFHGMLARVNLQTMTLIDTLVGFTTNRMHGSTLNPANNILYITSIQGNFIEKIDPNNPSNFQDQSLDASAPTLGDSLNGHDIIFSPDGSKYFVSCQGSSEVRVMKAKPIGQSDSLLHVISLPPGAYPQEFGLSASHNLLFVTCMEDVTTFPGNRGSVYAIDINTYTAIPIFTGYQPHGIAVDDPAGLVYVANRNFNVNGPAPHHSTVCGGKDGYVTIIDMSTLKIMPSKKIELARDPYSVAVRH